MGSGNHGATKKGIKIAKNRSSKPQFLAVPIASTGGGTYQIQLFRDFHGRRVSMETMATE
jgi:hypothetical protein